MEDWKKLLLAAGGAAGVAALVCFLLKQESSGGKRLQEVVGDKKTEVGIAIEDITKEKAQEILHEIIKSQEQMKGRMKELTEELLKEKLSFAQTYRRVREAQPCDPLEKYSLSMADFDKLLDKHQSDPAVRESIAKIMGSPNVERCTSEKVRSVSVQKVIDVHRFMLQQIEELGEELQSLADRAAYEPNVVTITAQTMAGAKIEDKFGLGLEDIESAVLLLHATLASHEEFAAIDSRMQKAMAKLMGTLSQPARG